MQQAHCLISIRFHGAMKRGFSVRNTAPIGTRQRHKQAVEAERRQHAAAEAELRSRLNRKRDEINAATVLQSCFRGCVPLLLLLLLLLLLCRAV